MKFGSLVGPDRAALRKLLTSGSTTSDMRAHIREAMEERAVWLGPGLLLVLRSVRHAYDGKAVVSNIPIEVICE